MNQPRNEGSSRCSRLVLSWIHHLFVFGTILIVGISWLPISETAPKPIRSISQAVQGVTVQGWGFFTRSPREPMVTPYIQQDGVWKSAKRGPNAVPRHVFGLDRSSRLTEFDVEIVSEELPDGTWMECNYAPLEECALTASSVDISTTGYKLRLCDEILLARFEPIPWAYRGQYENTPESIALVNVECENMEE